MMPPIDSSLARVRLLLHLNREQPAGKGALGHSVWAVEVRRSPWGKILMWVNAIIIQTHSLGRGISCYARRMCDTVGKTYFFQTGLTQICCLSNNGLLIFFIMYQTCPLFSRSWNVLLENVKLQVWVWWQRLSLTDRRVNDRTPSKSAAWQFDLTALFNPNILLFLGTKSSWLEGKK